MSKRIFTMQYDKKLVTEDELTYIGDKVSTLFRDDVFIVMPNGYQLFEMSLDELIAVRNTIDAVIYSLESEEEEVSFEREDISNDM